MRHDISKKHAPGCCDGLAVRCAWLSVNDTAEGWVKGVGTKDVLGCEYGVDACGGASCIETEDGF